MENNLFRKNAMDRISSPEQLQDYMRVTNPAVWMVLAAIIVLLAGLIIASVFGQLETKLPVRASIRDGLATIQVEGASADLLKEGMPVRVKDQEATIADVSWTSPQAVSVSAKVSLPDGDYDAVIVTESISPISFLTN